MINNTTNKIENNNNNEVIKTIKTILNKYIL